MLAVSDGRGVPVETPADSQSRYLIIEATRADWEGSQSGRETRFATLSHSLAAAGHGWSQILPREPIAAVEQG